MFKFLRKYDKWILAIGGSLLMITFLAPQAIQGLADYSAQTGATWATVGTPKERISVGEAEILRRQARLIDALGPSNPLNALGAGSDPAHWFLLLREAEAAGLVGGRANGFAFAEQIAANSGQNIDPQSIVITLGSQAGLNYEETLQTLADIQGVARLMAIISSSGRFSDARLKGSAARKGLGVSGDIVVLDARTDTTIPVPSGDEASLQAQLDAHASELAGDGEQGFGYRIPDRFQLEWIRITEAAVRASLEDSPDLSPIELRKAFQRDPGKFGAGPSATSAATPVFADHAEKVRSTLLDELVDKRLAEIAKFADDRLQFQQRGLDRDGLHLVLPEDWNTRRTSLEALAAEIGTEFGIPAPIRSTTDDWIVVEDLRDQERFGDIGTSATDLFGSQRPTLPKLVENIKEFGGEDTIPVQAGIAFPPLDTIQGDILIVRVFDADPSHPPADLDEVRAQVTSDVEALVRYETLLDRLPQIEATARTEGMRAVADAYDAPLEYAADIRTANLEFLVQYGISVTSSLPILGTEGDAITEVVERALELDPTIPVSDQPAERRIFAVPVPGRLAVLLVSIDAVRPMTEESWASLSGTPGALQRALSQDLAEMDPQALFGFEALKTRHAFEQSVSASEEDEFEDDLEDGAETKASAS